MNDQILFYFHKTSDLNGIQITRTQHLMSQIKALSFFICFEMMHILKPIAKINCGFTTYLMMTTFPGL